jgi:hypothetical protein
MRYGYIFGYPELQNDTVLKIITLLMERLGKLLEQIILNENLQLIRPKQCRKYQTNIFVYCTAIP